MAHECAMSGRGAAPSPCWEALRNVEGGKQCKYCNASIKSAAQAAAVTKHLRSDACREGQSGRGRPEDAKFSYEELLRQLTAFVPRSLSRAKKENKKRKRPGLKQQRLDHCIQKVGQDTADVALVTAFVSAGIPFSVLANKEVRYFLTLVGRAGVKQCGGKQWCGLPRQCASGAVLDSVYDDVDGRRREEVLRGQSYVAID